MWLDTPRSLLINIWEFSKYRATTRYIAWHDLARAPPIYHDVVLTGGDEPNDKSLMGGMSANENGNAVSDVENFTKTFISSRIIDHQAHVTIYHDLDLRDVRMLKELQA